MTMLKDHEGKGTLVESLSSGVVVYLVWYNYQRHASPDLP